MHYKHKQKTATHMGMDVGYIGTNQAYTSFTTILSQFKMFMLPLLAGLNGN